MYMRAEMKDIRRHKKYILIKTKEKTNIKTKEKKREFIQICT